MQHTGYGGDISLLSAENLQRTQYQLLISTAVKTELFNQQYTGDFDYRLIAIDAGIGGFSKGFVKHLYGNQSEVYRIDNRSALSAMMLSAIESMDLVDNVKGEFNYEGIRVVAGGEMGYHGDVIVDSITTPNCVIGIADGAGKTLYPPYDAEMTRKIKAIEKVIGA